MFKITVNDKVLTKLTEAFPKPANSAKRALDKYVSVLEEKLTESINRGQTEYERKLELHSIGLKKLSNSGGRIGPNTVRLHAWLKSNGLSLVEVVEKGTNLSGFVSRVKLTDLVKMTDSMSADQLSVKTDAELDSYLDDPLQSDKEFIITLLPDLAILTDKEIADQYDTTEIDIKSLKGYIKWLLTKATKMSELQKKQNLRQAQIILRVAQFFGGIFFQKKKKSKFGRMYYEGISVQSVSKSLRTAMLGDCYEYDIKSSVISWKMGFARECFDKMKSGNTFEDDFAVTFAYLEYKPKFTTTLIDDIYTADSKGDAYTHERDIKRAITALSFGARLTVKGWMDESGAIKNAAIGEIIRDIDVRNKFMKHEFIVKFSAEQKAIEQYLFDEASALLPNIKNITELQTSSGRLSKSKVVAYLYQHEETRAMDIVRAELGKLGRNVLANIHDAIIIRHKLSAYDKEQIELKMREQTEIEYWRLGETKLESYKVISDETLQDEAEYFKHKAAEIERAKSYIPKSF